MIHSISQQLAESFKALHLPVFIEEYKTSVSSWALEEKKGSLHHFSQNINVLTLQKTYQKIVKAAQSILFTPDTSVVKTPEAPPEKPENVKKSFLSNPEKLKKYSKLKKEKTPFSSLLTPSVLSFLSKRSNEDSSEVFISSLTYLREFFKHQDKPNDLLTKANLKAFQTAIDQEIRLNWPQYKNKAAAEQEELLKTTIAEMLEKVDHLPLKGKYLYFGKLGTDPKVPVHPLIFLALKDQLPAELSDYLTHQDSSKLATTLEKKIFQSAKQQGFLSEGFQEGFTSIQTVLQQVMSSANDAVETSDSPLTKWLISSLKEDAQELLKENIPETLRTWGDLLLNRGIEECIHQFLVHFLDQQKPFFLEQLNQCSRQGLDLVSPLLTELFLGSQEALQGEQLFWIEIAKEQDNTYTLSFFSNAVDDSIHPTMQSATNQAKAIPLVFKNINKETLNRDFFYRFLTYQAWPHWKEGFSYSFSHLYDWLKETCGEPVDCSLSTVVPLPFSLSSHKRDWLQLYLYHHLKEHRSELSTLFNYKISLHALCHLWPNIKEDLLQKKEAHLRQQMRSLADVLSSSGASLYEQKKISLLELKELYATLWEVETVLGEEEKAPPTNSSLLLPQELHHLISQYLPEMSDLKEKKEMLNVFLKSLLGEEFDATIEKLSEELASLPSQSAKGQSVERKAAEPPLRLETLYEWIEGLYPKRISPLHLYKTLIKLSHLFNYALHLTLQIKLLNQLFSLYAHLFLGAALPYTTLLSLAIALAGPYVLRQWIPHELFSTVHAIYSLTREVSDYLIKRIFINILPKIIKPLIPEQELEKIRRFARTIQQRLTRVGELEFTITPYHPTPKVMGTYSPAFLREKKLPELVGPQSPEMPVLNMSPETFIGNVKEWTLYADKLSESEAHCYIHQCIRELPIPIGENKQWWDHQPPLVAMETLHELLYRLSTTTRAGDPSRKNNAQLYVSHYTLYAIMDYLCRKLPEAHIPQHLTPNATGFIVWLQRPMGACTNPRTYKQLMDLLEYFDIDPTKTYTDKELSFMNDSSLFRHGINSIRMIDTLPKLSHTLYNYEQFTMALDGTSRTAFWRAELDYYLSLLQDEKVAKRLDLHFSKLQSTKNPSYYEKLQLLFQDPSLKESLAEKADVSIKADYLEGMSQLADLPEDPRLGILPRSVYILRLTHLLASSWQILKKSEDASPPELRIEKSRYLIAFPWLDAVGKKLHQLTGHIFHYEEFHSNIISRSLVHPNTVCIEGLPSSKLEELAQTTHSKASFFNRDRRDWGYSSRTQNEIVLKPKNYFPQASREENRVLEMMRTDPADQVVRALSFFSQAKHLLKNPHYFKLFQVLVHNTSALHKALIERPSLAKEIGQQFGHLADYFSRQKEWNVSFELTRLAQEVLSHCQYYEPTAADFFPDPTDLVLDQIIPFYRKVNRYIIQDKYKNLLSDYLLLTPETIKPSQRKKIMHAIARCAYAQSWLVLPPAECKTVFYTWKAEIEKTIQEDGEFREKLLDELALDFFMQDTHYPEMHLAAWSGTFPLYRKKSLSLHLNPFSCPSTLGDLLSFKYVGGDWYRKLGQEEYQGDGFREDHILWVQTDQEKPFIMHELPKEQPAKLYMSTKEGAQSSAVQIVDMSTWIPLGEISHQLSLLYWFQPSSAISVRLSTDHSKIEELRFDELKLLFTLKTVEGVERAFDQSGAAPGYFITPKQHHPILVEHGQYLLLENEKKEKKVHLVTLSNEVLITAYLIRHLGHMNLAPWIRAQIQEICAGASKMGYKTYSLSESGELKSFDPEALLYLALFFHIQGDHTKSKDYFIQFKQWGNIHPFPENVFATIEAFLLPLLLVQTPEAEKLLLELVTLRERNILLQHSQKEITCSSNLRKILLTIATQAKYQSYLQKIERGMAPYLSPYDELFLLKSLLRETSDFLSWINWSQLHEYKLDWILELGLDNIAPRLLFLSKICNRYLSLRKLYEKESESWKSAASELLLNQLFPLENNSPHPSPGQPDTSSYVKQTSLLKLFSSMTKKTAQERSLSTVKTLYFSFFEPCNLETLTLHPSTLTPEFIQKHFFSLYRLAMNRVPTTWREDEEKKALFQRHLEWLKKHLPLMQGDFQKQSHFFLFDLLLTLLFSEKDREDFPSPPKLEKAKNLSEQLTNIFQIYQRKICGRKIVSISAKAFASTSTLKATFELGKAAALRYVNISSGYSFYKPIADKAISMFSSVLWPKNSPPALTVESAPLPPSVSVELINAMKEKESTISQQMTSLLETYFDITILPEEPREPHRIEREDLSLNLEEGSIEKAIKELNQNLEEFYARPQPPQKAYQWKEGKNADLFIQELKALKIQASTQLENDARAIEKIVDQSRKKPSKDARLLSRLRKEEHLQKSLSFEEILYAWAQGHLKGPNIDNLIFPYLIAASRWNFFSEQTDLLLASFSEKSLPLIAVELDRKRVYRFLKKRPLRLLQGKLLFETKFKKLLWKNQSRQIDRLLTSSHQNLVVELIMGSGKTIFGIPLEGFVGADGEQLVINTWPASLAKTNIATALKQGTTIFGQVVHALETSRSTKWTVHKAWALRMLFEQAIFQKEQINKIKEGLQALELSWLEMSLDIDIKFSRQFGTSNWIKILEHLRQALKTLRLKAVNHVDEAHSAYQQRKELNYPLGRSKTLPKRFVKFIEEVLWLLLQLEDFQHLLTIKKPQPSPLKPEEFSTHIAPALAAAIVELHSLHIPLQERESCQEYLLGKATKIPDFVQKSPFRKELDLAKGLVTILLPGALSKTINVNFASSQTGNGEYARPAEGNNNPLEEATIRNPFEALVKTGLLLAHNRLETSQLEKLLSSLHQQAQAEAVAKSVPLEDTPTARLFGKEIPGHQLSPQIYEGTSSLYPPGELQEIYQAMNRSDRLILTYLSLCISREIRYFDKNLSSTSANFASMTARTLGDTGTPFNDGEYLTGTKVLFDPGTNGESIDLILQPGKASTHILKTEAPLEILQELIEEFFAKNPKIRAIIDRGALLNGLSSSLVASELLRYISRSREEIKGVAFYSKDQCMIWEKGATSPIPIEQSSLKIEERISYFPQPQTFGADILQIGDAVGLVTIGEDLGFSELAQAIWRFRGLRGAQTLVFVMTDRVKRQITNKESPTIQEIFAFAKINENQKLFEYYESSRKNMFNVIRRAVLDKMEFAPSIYDHLALVKEFSSLIVHEIPQDPTILFGSIDLYTEPENVFQALIETCYGKIKNSKSFTVEEKENILLELKEQRKGQYPPLVHTYESNGALKADSLLDLNQTSQIEETTDQNNHREVDLQAEQELEINLDQQNSLSGQKPKPQVFCPWPTNLNPTQVTTWLIQSPSEKKVGSWWQGAIKIPMDSIGKVPPIFSLSEAFFQAEQPQMRFMAKTIAKRILASNNIIHLQAPSGYPIDPFSFYQMPLLEALIIKEESKDRPEILLLNQQECKYWRQKLKEDREGKYERDDSVKMCLYDLSTRMIVAEGFHPFETKHLQAILFKRALAQLRFLRGDVSFDKDLIEPLTQWIKHNLAACSQYAHYISTLHGITPLEGSQLNLIILQLEEAEKKIMKPN
ncbi:MAG: DUF3638 domain-containing protein [Chlamydiales bacterium]|nr:DUF3638 domain-containing protein [Chlamydiales bacterium]